MTERYGPTPKAEWCKVGDTVEALLGGMRGEALRIVTRTSIPQVTVQWESGSVGRHIITILRIVNEEK